MNNDPTLSAADAETATFAAMPRLPERFFEFPPLDRQPPPPVVSRRQTLPFGDLPWEYFERLCVQAVHVRDGATDARLFGGKGEDQGGIDVYTRMPDGTRCVYQVRRVEFFGPADLRSALDHFLRDRPVTAGRFVICLARRATTALLRELERLRDTHKDLDLDVYDRRVLSESLRSQRALVERFFGPAWSEIFCDGRPAQPLGHQIMANPPSPAGAPRWDALVRGPVRALGLQPQLDEAEQSEAQRPERAAELYATLASRLTARGFPSHARRMLENQASALEKAQRYVDAFEAWFALVLADLQAGEEWPRPGLDELEKLLPNLPPSDAQLARARTEVLAGFEDRVPGLM